jgi:hypothetical protein
MKYCEVIDDNLSKAGWSWGCVSAVDREGRTIWIADAHRDDGKRFVVRADERVSAFVELESAIPASEAGSGQRFDNNSTSWRKGLSRADINILTHHRRI